MIKNWVADIRIKTKNMDRNAKTEYIMNYYWYHILLGVLTIGILVLGIYHVTWRKKKTAFSLVIVNQDISYQRDQKLSEDFAEWAALPPKQIQADSDYMISYGDVQLKGINESSYEKFFFGWQAGAMDAVIMPESFYAYCRKQNGIFLPLAQLSDSGQLSSLPDPSADQQLYFKEDGICYGVYVTKTGLSTYFMENEQDPYILVFPAAMKQDHRKAAGRFLEYALSEYSEQTQQSGQEG